jgi:hypothetical protein
MGFNSAFKGLRWYEFMEYLNLYAHCNESWLFLEIFVTANI